MAGPRTADAAVQAIICAVLDVLDRDFVLTARGKGLTERRVLFFHVLRAALTPMLTMVGMDLGGPDEWNGVVVE